MKPVCLVIGAGAGIGGNVGKRRIFNDFKIVACATIKNCDIIASDDNHDRIGQRVCWSRW